MLNSVLNENSWSAIKWASKNNVGQNYWSVGDCKEITMNGKVSDGLTLTNYTAWVYIIGFNHNAEREGNGITFQGFKVSDNGTSVCLVDSGYNASKDTGTWFNMNNTIYSTGGWEASQMRKNIMPLIKAAFPEDLRSVIKTCNIFTTTNDGDAELTETKDDIFLLAEFEIYGATAKASTKESDYLKQYVYYTVANRRVKYKHDSPNNTSYWWQRSIAAIYQTEFCYVGNFANSYGLGTTISIGVAPCFKI